MANGRYNGAMTHRGEGGCGGASGRSTGVVGRLEMVAG